MGEIEGLSLLRMLEGLIALWEQGGHAPDRWETFCVMAGIAHVESKNERAARRSVAFAQLPPELRPPSYFNKIPTTFELLQLWHIRLAVDDAVNVWHRRVARKSGRGVLEAS